MADQTLQALKALHGQFALLKETAARREADLQRRLDLALSRNQKLESRVSELTKEVDALKHQQEVIDGDF